MLKCNLRHWMADSNITTIIEVANRAGLEHRTLDKLKTEEGIKTFR